MIYQVTFCFLAPTSAQLFDKCLLCSNVVATAFFQGDVAGSFYLVQ